MYFVQIVLFLVHFNKDKKSLSLQEWFMFLYIYFYLIRYGPIKLLSRNSC